MLDRLAHEWASGANRFSAPGECYLGLWADGELCAVGGLNRDPYPAGEGLGRVRHFYVHARRRRAGHGSALLRFLIAQARPHFAALRLRTGNPAAARFYAAHGFVRTAMPAATHWLALDRGFRHAARRRVPLFGRLSASPLHGTTAARDLHERRPQRGCNLCN